MRVGFSGYYRPSQDELAELWKNCVFILDTNVLLGLYRYPKQAYDDLIGVLKRVSNRLWIPHQVALVYQENRLDVIAEQVSKYSEVNNILANTRTAQKLLKLRNLTN